MQPLEPLKLAPGRSCFLTMLRTCHHGLHAANDQWLTHGQLWVLLGESGPQLSS